MGNTIKTTERVKRVHQTGDEADGVVLPPSGVDPSPEDELWVAVFGGACDNSDQDGEPADLQVKERELVQGGNDLVAEHDNAGGK